MVLVGDCRQCRSLAAGQHVVRWLCEQVATTEATVIDRGVQAPGLNEVAQIWWDTDAEPVVRWQDGGAVFVLTAPVAGAGELLLARFDPPPADPRGMAEVLAAGLAACDFPPTGDGAAPGRVAATLAAARRPERPLRD